MGASPMLAVLENAWARLLTFIHISHLQFANLIDGRRRSYDMDGRKRQDASFGEVHFGKAQLGDARRTRRLVKTADLIMEHPGGTLPQKLSQWSDLMGMYRLVSADEVTHQTVMQSHCERTLQWAAQSSQVVLFIHDSTELDYTHVPALSEQLGQIGNGGGRGYVCHNTLVVTAAD